MTTLYLSADDYRRALLLLCGYWDMERTYTGVTPLEVLGWLTPKRITGTLNTESSL